MRILLALLAALLFCSSANGQPRELIISGVGAMPCAQVLRNYHEDPKTLGYVALTWAQGFWSSQNDIMLRAGARELKNLAGDSGVLIKALMDGCTQQPSTDFGLVVRGYFGKLPDLRNPNVK